MRIHAFEFCDQTWLPRFLRDAETSYLAGAIALGRPFDPLAELIAPLVESDDRILDLGSGGAGPWPALAEPIANHRGRRVAVTLTDLHPNERAGIHPVPVDARAIPVELTGVRTMFDAFHHLRPADARAVLADAARAGRSIVIGEAMGRRAGAVIATLLIPLFVLLLTPRTRPTLGALVFTYLIPVLPLILWWDGLVSCLRTYSPAELRELARGLDGLAWEAGTRRHRGATVTYLVGRATILR